MVHRPEIALKPTIFLNQPRRRISFLGALKRKAEEIRLFPFVKTRIPLGAKVAVGSLLTPRAPLVIGRAALRVLPRLGRALVPKTVKGALIATATIPTTALVIAKSPRAREALRFAFDPRKAPERAEIITGVIEDPSSILPREGQTLKEKVIQAGKAAGLVGAGVAAAAGAVAVAGRAIRKRVPRLPSRRPRKEPDLPPIAFLPAAPSLTPSTQPLGAVEKPKEELPVVVKPVKERPINIRNTFNPTIDISFRKSRKFINQQILVR